MTAQTVEVEIRLPAKDSQRAVVIGRFLGPDPPRELRFLTEYGGIRSLTDRLSGLAVNGVEIDDDLIEPGRIVSAAAINTWTYHVSLAPQRGLSAAAHLSWFVDGEGILMLGDLLPQLRGHNDAKITFEIHEKARIVTTERKVGSDSYSVTDLEKAVFHITTSARVRNRSRRGVNLTVNLAGEWLFEDNEPLRIAESLVSEYSRSFGNLTAGDYLISIGKYPIPNAGHGRWDAGTRGRSINLLAADMPFKSQSIQRLHEQLRHEVFHLWVPNSLTLTGNYDWFYEGFALYQSLKTGVSIGAIRFDDMLDAVSRAHTIDRSAPPRRPLVEASRERWSEANTLVYARGMLVAFACDLAILDATSGRRSVTELIGDVISVSRSLPASDGNATVLSVMQKEKRILPLISESITGVRPVNLAPFLEPVGLDLNYEGRVSVSRKLSGRQKKLLEKLGISSWRSVSAAPY